jgi:hypothetical protein
MYSTWRIEKYQKLNQNKEEHWLLNQIGHKKGRSNLLDIKQDIDKI